MRGVLKLLLTGLRDRVTAGTNMSEHSSRSCAIMQLQVTEVMADTDESAGAVVTRTRVCKATMVDLAGSEHVSQSGIRDDRFEKAKNIDLSLSTLRRVIQQFSEQQYDKHVEPAHRNSVLTWLLSDSLGGNSKMIMLATVAPSACCYQQALITLRFAGAAKRVVKVASVSKKRHFQQFIARLRQRIVQLTLLLEGGKAAEVHLGKIDTPKQEKEGLLSENDVPKAKVAAASAKTVLQSPRKRVKELESGNEELRLEGQSLQQRMLSSTATLRDEVAQQRAAAPRLHESLSKQEAEAVNRADGYRAVVSTTSPVVTAITDNGAGAGTGRLNGKAAMISTTASCALGGAAGTCTDGGLGYAVAASAAATSTTTASAGNTTDMLSAERA
jgi:hypothetical protein